MAKRSPRSVTIERIGMPPASQLLAQRVTRPLTGPWRLCHADHKAADVCGGLVHQPRSGAVEAAQIPATPTSDSRPSPPAEALLDRRRPAALPGSQPHLTHGNLQVRLEKAGKGLPAASDHHDARRAKEPESR